ncbi:tricorn protease domain 2-containing protein [Piedraia hortae CBS 480.64]|uniref:Tricorn protease domain 2-containing protein n=1 Tax=Piedraia hortae CBS 480.64 TaxID=1314780 RepID=A0A6A7BPG8_9PEZI|nr:tricorn protease domain 2-containing protein [Piedraia hortae CBS 480.64]
MAWLDKLGEMVECLKQLQKAIDSNSSPKLHAFVADALRWVPANRDLISYTPLQTYLSAVASAPSNSVVRNSFRSEEEEFLQVWQPVATDWGFELQTLRGHSDYILSITPSIDGRRLVTIASDNTARLWDVESGTEEKSTEINSSGGSIPIFASAFPEEDIVVIAGSSGDYWRWNLEDDARRIDLKLPSVAYSVSVSPNGRYAAWGLKTGDIYIWDAENDAGQVLESHNSPLKCMAFSSDSETLVSGYTDIWKWSAQAGHEILCQVGTNIKCIAICPDCNFVVFGSDAILVLHCNTHQVQQIMQVYTINHGSLFITSDPQKVLIGDGLTHFLYDFQTQQEPKELFSGTQWGNAMTLSPDGKAIWPGHWGGRITQLDVDLVIESQNYPTVDTAVVLSTDGRSLVSFSGGNQLSLWNIETRICERRLADDRLLHNRFTIVASLLESVDNAVLIWDMDADELRELKDRPGRVTALELSPDNKTLLCGLRDGQIWAIDLERGALRKKFTGNTVSIRDITIFPDGQNFASSSHNGTIRIWGPNLQTPLVLSSKREVREACFLADNIKYILDWVIEKEKIVRAHDSGCYGGSIFIGCRFVSSRLRRVMDSLAANGDNQPQMQGDSSVSTESTSIFESRQILALDPTEQWITVNG